MLQSMSKMDMHNNSYQLDALVLNRDTIHMNYEIHYWKSLDLMQQIFYENSSTRKNRCNKCKCLTNWNTSTMATKTAKESWLGSNNWHDFIA